jgi:cyclohexadienyl dehydratase
VRVIENAGGTNEQFAKQSLPNASLTIDQDNTDVFGQLVAGTADVMVTDAIEAIYQSKQHPELVALQRDKPFTTDHEAYMLPNGSNSASRRPSGSTRLSATAPSPASTTNGWVGLTD